MAKPIPIPIPATSPRLAFTIETSGLAKILPSYRNPLVRIEPPTPIACSLPGRLRYMKEKERQDSWGAESGVSVHEKSVPCMFETDTESIVGKLQDTFQDSMQCLIDRGHLQGIGLDQIKVSIILGTSLTPFALQDEEERAIYHRKQDRRKREEISVSPEAWNVLRYWAKEKYDMTGEVMVVQLKVIVPSPTIINEEVIRPECSTSTHLSIASSRLGRWILPPTTLRTDSPMPLLDNEAAPNPESTYICIGCSDYFDISSVTDGSQISEHVYLEEREVGEEAGWYCFTCLSKAYRRLRRDMEALKRGESVHDAGQNGYDEPADSDPDSMKATAIERGIKILDRISAEQLEDIEEESDQDDTPKPSKVQNVDPTRDHDHTGTATPESEATAIDLADLDMYKPVTTATTATDRFAADEANPFSRRMTPPDAIPSTLLWIKTPVDKLSPRTLNKALDEAAKVYGEKVVYREDIVVKPLKEGGSGDRCDALGSRSENSDEVE